MLVVTANGTELEIEKALAPYHEFECTGIDDEYVQSFDEIDELRAQWITSQDTYPELREFISYWTDRIEVAEGFRRLPGDENTKFGYTVVRDDGEVIASYKRTNPNQKWDWYEIGGRWSNTLLLNDGSSCDVAKKSDINFEGIRLANIVARRQQLDEIMAIHFSDMSNEEFIDLWNEFRKFKLEFTARWQEAKNLDDFNTCSKLRDDHWSSETMKEFAQSGITLLYDEFRGINVELTEDNPANWPSRAPGLTSFAILADGQWHESGSMGWFGIVSDETDEATWNKIFSDAIDMIADDHFIAVVDCHI